MIDAYVWTTPNGFKALIALEELALPYERHWVNITKGEQHRPEYLAINPNNKIPAIVDREGPDGKPLAVFESGAVLIYLADKAGKLLPRSGAARYTTIEWVFFNAANTGPMLGQYGYFTKFASEKIPHAIDRYANEAERLFKIVDKRLGEVPYLAGELSIADIMNFTWLRAARTFFGLDLSCYANLTRWLDELEQRPAFAKALAMKPA